MSYLVDTNVLSERCRARPNPAVRDWLAKRPAATLLLSVLTLGVIRKGVQGVADTRRRQALSDWLEVDLPACFSGPVLVVDTTVAHRWGRLVAEAGRSLPAMDSLLAATAAAHDLVLVTRHLRNLAGLRLQVFNPWGS